MLFNSFEFLLFFIIVLILYFRLPKNAVMPMMIVASCVFYCFFIPAYLIILFVVILVDYFSGIGIDKYPAYKKLLLIMSIFSNLGILFVFKYYDFFIKTSNELLGTEWSLLNVILPIGLSFHTFQSMSYVIEVYHGRYPVEKNIGYFSLYVLYFPQLVAGPIECPQNLLPQFKKERHFSWDNILLGGRLILWGLFKKAVIADRISFYVNGIFKDASQYETTQVALGVFFFTIQIYCDFSGYSDMAVGISKCFGIDLMFNFNRPLLASNLKELWARWHISLYLWFKKYIYIPLGGNKKGIFVMSLNILLVFLISGLWHGAGFNYIIWGFLNGVFILLYLLINPYLPHSKHPIVKYFGILLTFTTVALIFVFFRSENLQQAKAVFNQLLHPSGKWIFSGTFDQFAYGNMNLLFIMTMIVGMFMVERKVSPPLSFFTHKSWGDILFCIGLILLIFFTGIFTKQHFIYFQF